MPYQKTVENAMNKVKWFLIKTFLRLRFLWNNSASEIAIIIGIMISVMVGISGVSWLFCISWLLNM
jgi:hypothetical protein